MYVYIKISIMYYKYYVTDNLADGIIQ